MKKLLLAVASVFLLAAGCGQQSTVTGQGQQNQNTNQTINNPAPASTAPAATEAKNAGSSVYTGVLKVSDDPAKGSLMIVTNAGPNNTPVRLYIRTQRDFSQLVGKKVIVSYQGSADSFSLDNIVEDTSASK